MLLGKLLADPLIAENCQPIADFPLREGLRGVALPGVHWCRRLEAAGNTQASIAKANKVGPVHGMCSENQALASVEVCSTASSFANTSSIKQDQNMS